MKEVVTNTDHHSDNIQQEIGLRIWNANKSSILLYLSKKSATWTLPSVKITNNFNVLDSISLLLEQFVNTDLVSAVCIINTKEIIPIRLSNDAIVTNVSFQYTVYDAVFKFQNLSDIKFPENVRFSQFMSLGYIKGLVYKTPILNHLLKYMKEDK